MSQLLHRCFCTLLSFPWYCWLVKNVFVIISARFSEGCFQYWKCACCILIMDSHRLNELDLILLLLWEIVHSFLLFGSKVSAQITTSHLEKTVTFEVIFRFFSLSLVFKDFYIHDNGMDIYISRGLVYCLIGELIISILKLGFHSLSKYCLLGLSVSHSETSIDRQPEYSLFPAGFFLILLQLILLY